MHANSGPHPTFLQEPSNNPVWAELIQLIPAIVLASSFIASGTVDLSRAAPLFLLSAALTAPISALVLWRGHLLNPILAGAALWLWCGALAFNLPVPPLADLLGEAKASGLFMGSFAFGVGALALSPWGYLGARARPEKIRAGSLVLLGLTGIAIAWTVIFRQDPRLGGGAPFIALNVARRLLVVWASRP